MNAHPGSGQFARYYARTLPPAEIARLLAHVETCAECRQALSDASPSGIVPLLLDASEPHLGEEEMVAFVEGRRPEAAAHIAACELCRESVEAMEDEAVKPARPRPAGRRFPWIALFGCVAAVLIVAALLRFRPVPRAASPAPQVLATLMDAGDRVELEADGSLRGIDGLSPEEAGLVRDALATRRLPAGPAFPAEKPGVLLAPGTVSPAFSPTAPLNSRVLSDQPEFSWSRDPRAMVYQVVVTRENLDPVARSARITGTEWQPDRPLPRGVVLLWEVRAWHGGETISVPAPPAPPARFEIVSDSVASRLEQLRAPPRPCHLLAAILCAREGLREEAAKELRELLRENPNSQWVLTLSESP